MKNYFLGLFLMIALLACDTVVDKREMLDTQVQLKGLIKEQLGVDSRVGFNLDSGVLIDVSIAFDAGDVANRSVSELTNAAKNAIKQSFKTKPMAIYIQLGTTAN